MDAFETELKRAFAAPADPVDEGFSVNVSTRVAKVEQRRSWSAMARNAGLGVAGLAALVGVMGLAQGLAPDLIASLGMGFAKAHGAVAQAEVAAPQALSQDFNQGVQSLVSLGLTQIMVLAAMLAGGVYAVRQAAA